MFYLFEETGESLVLLLMQVNEGRSLGLETTAADLRRLQPYNRAKQPMALLVYDSILSKINCVGPARISAIQDKRFAMQILVNVRNFSPGSEVYRKIGGVLGSQDRYRRGILNMQIVPRRKREIDV